MAEDVLRTIESKLREELGPELTADEALAIVREVRKARRELRKKVREFWDSDAGQKLRDFLSFVAHATGFASEMESIMSEVASRIEEAAERAGLHIWYTWAWGKRPRKRT